MSTLGPLHLPHSGRGGGIRRRCSSWGWRYHWNHLKPVPHGLLLSRRRAEGGRSQPGWGEEYGRIPAGNAGFHWRGGWTPRGRRARVCVCVCTHGVCAHTCTCVCAHGGCVCTDVCLCIFCVMCTCVHLCLCAHMDACTHVCACMYAHVGVCVCARVCTSLCVHV